MRQTHEIYIVLSYRRLRKSNLQQNLKPVAINFGWKKSHLLATDALNGRQNGYNCYTMDDQHYKYDQHYLSNLSKKISLLTSFLWILLA